MRLGRDLVFLLSGPISAILYSIIKVIGAVQSYGQGGIDAEFPLIYGLRGTIAICALAFLYLIIGTITFALPSKPNN